MQGGLKAGLRDVWIDGHPPELAITAFDSTFRVRVTSISQPDNGPVLDDIVNTNTRIDLPPLTTGDYSVEALAGDRLVDRRYMRVRSWDLLEPSEPTEPFGTQVGEWVLRGGLLIGVDAASIKRAEL